jgi:tRNA1(Val) A37 N6-methylase TrmN6
MVADLTNKIERLQIQTKQVASIHLQEEMAKLSKERARLSENKAEIELWKEDLDALEKALKPTP